MRHARTHAMAYIHRSMYIWTTAPFVFLFVWFKQRQQRPKEQQRNSKTKTETKQTYRREWVALVGLRVPIRHWEEGAASLFPWPVQSCRHCRLSCRVCLRGFGSELNPPPLSFPSLRYPVLSQMFSHSCKGQWKRFLNLCQHTGEREEEIFIIYRSKVWLMFHE